MFSKSSIGRGAAITATEDQRVKDILSLAGATSRACRDYVLDALLGLPAVEDMRENDFASRRLLMWPEARKGDWTPDPGFVEIARRLSQDFNFYEALRGR